MFLKPVIAAFWLLIVTVCGDFISYPRPSIYTKSAHFSLKVNGTYMYTVSYAGYDYVQLSMDEGYATEFRIAITDQAQINTYSISPRQLPITSRVDGNELIFSLSKAHYLIVQINDEKEFVVLVDPAEMDIPSPTGSNVYNVLSYNTDNTGGSVTKGIQAAMDAAAEYPGSIVYVPPGLYLTGNLLLRSQTSLYLAGGAVLRFTGQASDYTTLYTKTGLGPGTWWIQTEINSTDIKVYGRGTIDGNGYNTRQNRFMADLLVPVGTTNFRADGVLLRDGSFWTVTPIQSEHVYLVNLKILNRQDVGENDGVDIIESRRVTVRRTIAISLDDSFSTKTWPYQVGTTVPYPYQPQPLSDVLFDNCLAWSACYGYKIGQGAYERQDNVAFQNSVVYRAAVGLGIDHKSGSAMVNNVTFESMDVEDLSGVNAGHAAWLSVFVENSNQGVGPVTTINVKNIRAREQGSRHGLLQGYNSSYMVSGVTLTDVYMYANTTPATTLAQMNLLDTSFSEDIKIINS